MKNIIWILFIFSFCTPQFSLPLVAAEQTTMTQDNDQTPIEEPEEDESGDYIWSDGAYFMSFYQVRKILDFSWWLQKLHLLPKEEAENVTVNDDVLDSSWFTNRHEVNRLNSEALARGVGAGVQPQGPWRVIKGKTLGINPGFVVKDQEGRRLFVKFDPPKFPSLGTNGDVIGSRILHAAGYFVPEYYEMVIDTATLTLDPKATSSGKYKKKRPMTQEDLDGILARAPRNKEGQIFGNVSIGLPGKPKGPFNYLGIRKEDPNDTVLHENRRELRGLRIIMAWLNNTDSRRGNTLDIYVKDKQERGTIRHYLIDFSASFGSGNIRPKQSREGHEYFFDPSIVSRSFSAVGLWLKPWEKPKLVIYPEIGRFEAITFEPKKWRGSYANPAFEKMTARDAFWGAKIVTAFTDEDIRDIVQTGSFYSPGAEDYLVKTLADRRDLIGEYFFNGKRFNPLDRFTIEDSNLHFRNVAVSRGYADKDQTLYRYRVGRKPWETIKTTTFPLKEIKSNMKIKIQTSRNQGKNWSKSIKVKLTEDEKELRIKTIKR